MTALLMRIKTKVERVARWYIRKYIFGLKFYEIEVIYIVGPGQSLFST
jgi:hypothetical protein